MNTLNCLIVDDEELARRLILAYCERLPQLRVVGQAATALEALAALREHRVDILFLDIQMPEMKGTELLRVLRDQPAVILTTAYREYALEGYELNVTDYLLKPIPFPRFLAAIQKVEARRAYTTEEVAPAPPTHHVVRADHKIYRLPYAELLYVEGAREYVIYHTESGKTMALGSLKQLATDLPDNFMRIHKSYIVDRDRIEYLDGNQVRIGQKDIPVGGSYRAAVVALFAG